MTKSQDIENTSGSSGFNIFLIAGILIPLVVIFIAQALFNLIASWLDMEVALELTVNMLGYCIFSFFLMSVSISFACFDSRNRISPWGRIIASTVSVIVVAGTLVLGVSSTNFVLSPEEKALMSKPINNGYTRSDISSALQDEYGYTKVSRLDVSDMVVQVTTKTGNKEFVNIMKYRGFWIMYEDKAELMHRINKVDAGSYPKPLKYWYPTIPRQG